VLTPEGTEKRPIVPGLSNDRMVEVREGLSEDEQVLLTGKDRARVAEQGAGEKGSKGKGKGGPPSGGTEGGGGGGPPGGKGKPG